MKTKNLSISKMRKNTPKINLSGILFFTLLTIILLSACGGQDARNDPGYFIPPTLASKPATATPLPTATPEPEPTNEALCINDLRFISDVTYPDDTVVAPNQEIEKVWLVQNNGTCNWEADYTLRNVGGSPMGASTIQALYPVRSGGEYEITITFYAPTDAGAHNSNWQAHDPEGEPFGQAFYIQIVVDPDLVQGED
ncbi:MAG: NBR1-Ig-like domain-containing protein [Anaerolineales bacterium]